MMISNAKVVSAWHRGVAAKAGHLHTDGRRIWSYGWYEIGRRLSSNLVVLAKDTWSKSTARHISLCNRGGDEVIFVGRDPSREGSLGTPDWNWYAWKLFVKTYTGSLRFDTLKLQPSFAHDPFFRQLLKINPDIYLSDVSEPGLLSLRVPIWCQSQIYVDKEGTVKLPFSRLSVHESSTVRDTVANAVYATQAPLSDRVVAAENPDKWHLAVLPGVDPLEVAKLVEGLPELYEKIGKQ